jgi:hypothetical protein
MVWDRVSHLQTRGRGKKRSKGGCTREFGGMMVSIVTVVTRKWNVLRAELVWHIY